MMQVFSGWLDALWGLNSPVIKNLVEHKVISGGKEIKCWANSKWLLQLCLFKLIFESEC